MPYINLNGRLIEVTQEQFDTYTTGLRLDPLGRDNINTQPDNPAAGGDVTVSNSATTPILTPNTTNNTPGQTLTIADVQVAVKKNLAQDDLAKDDLVVNTEPKSVGNPPDPQVPAPPTLKDQIVAVDNAQPVPTSTVPLTAEQRQIQNLYAAALPDSSVNTPTREQQIKAVADAENNPTTNSITSVNANTDAQAKQADAPAKTVPVSEVNTSATPVKPTSALSVAYDEDGNLNPGYALDEGNNPVYVGGGYVDKATSDQAAIDRAAARQQQVRSVQNRQVNQGDWRLRLSLADSADYLYMDPDISRVGILYPLQTTAGVLFPYTPQISTSYNAGYSSYDLMHSNYRGYFYQNSFVNDITVNATFTAQDTTEANYLLAVIHFFRSVTKMFYGQDAQRGTPPPVCFLSGLGEFQFNKHPVLVKTFNYTLPADVDYIRARSPNQVGLDLSSNRARATGTASNAISAQANRLANALLKKGAVKGNGATPGVPNLGLNNPTYVPTKIDIQLTLLPIQSRQQVSRQFSVKEFANGNLLKGGFW
jgi:hypothetical protein